MQEELKSQINKAIETSLPKQVGDVLAKRLKEADDLESQVKTLKEAKNDLVEKLNKVSNDLSRFNNIEKDEAFVEKAKKEIEEGYRKLEVEKLRYQLNAEKEKTQLVREIAISLTRNTTYRSNVFGSTGNECFNKTVNRDAE